jgi:hypothetical protein
MARSRGAPIRLQSRRRRSRLASLQVIAVRAAIRYSVMLYGVADVLRTILFIPDPFRR